MTAGFVGRRAELARLEQLADQFDVVAVCGPGAIGKSRLVAEWSAGRSSTALIHESDARDLEARLAAVLNSSADAPETLILDDCDPAITALPELLEPWRARGRATFVTTSRERPGLGYEGLLELGPLEDESAVELMQWHLARLGLPPAPEDVAMSIVGRLDCFPGLIELALQDAEILGTGQLLARLEAGALGDPERLSKLLLGPSDKLAEETRLAFDASTVFAGSFDVESLASVADLDDAFAALRELSHNSLVHRVDHERTPRFATYGVVARAAVAASDERAALLDRHAQHFVERGPAETSRRDAYAERWGVELRAVVDRALDALVPPELGVAAMALAVAAPTPDAARLSRTLELVRQAEEPPPGSTAVLVAAAQAALRAGEQDEARGLLDEADRAASTQLDAIITLNARASAERVRGRDDEALAYYLRALDEIADVDAPWMKGRLRANFAAVLWETGEREQAHAEMANALAIHRADGDVRAEGFVLGNRGVMYHHEGELEIARTFHLDALERHRTCGHRRYEAIALFDLGALEQEVGALRAALRYYDASRDLLAKLGDRRLAALAAAAADSARAGLGHDGTGEVRRTLEGDVFDAALDLYRRLAEAYRAVRLTDHGGLEPFDHAPYGEEIDEVLRPARLLHIVTTAADADRLVVVAADGDAFRGPGAGVADVERRAALRGILGALVDARLDGASAASPAALIRAGWPEEKIDESAALNRLHVALSTLRKLGLRGVLETTDDGSYRLDPSYLVVVSPR